MRKRFAPVVALATGALALTGAAAGGTHATMRFTATLNAGQEVPHPVGTKAGASGKFTATVTGTASYSAWYELVPATSVPIKLKVSPGNKVSASVKVNGTNVTLTFKNLTRKTNFTKTLTMAAPDVSSAEWIAEAPARP